MCDLGEWLNGRVAVSKTVGCVFESRLPCQTIGLLLRADFVLCSAYPNVPHAAPFKHHCISKGRKSQMFAVATFTYKKRRAAAFDKLRAESSSTS